jgi:hypothetical protein
MLDRMLAMMVRDRQRFTAALGAHQYDQMVLAMRAARPVSLFARLFGPRT